MVLPKPRGKFVRRRTGKPFRVSSARDEPSCVAAAATLVAIDCAAVEPTPVTDLAFKEASACRVNEIPRANHRIEARRTGAQLEVKVAANFGCSTNAGKARVEAGRGG